MDSSFLLKMVGTSVQSLKRSNLPREEKGGTLLWNKSAPYRREPSTNWQRLQHRFCNPKPSNVVQVHIWDGETLGCHNKLTHGFEVRFFLCIPIASHKRTSTCITGIRADTLHGFVTCCPSLCYPPPSFTHIPNYTVLLKVHSSRLILGWRGTE